MKINTEKIKSEAKKIIDSFSKELDKIEDLEESILERESDRREEGKTREEDSDFRKRLLSNAPESKKGYIRAEKGGWVK